MGLNDTVLSERIHISFFGARNAGKSSLVNAVTGQDLSVVSDIPGTTTDPVRKTMELLPLGPVVIIDTPGYDDIGALGEKRVQKTKQILGKTDIAVLVVDAAVGMGEADREMLRTLQQKNLPYLIVMNKADLLFEREKLSEKELYVSTFSGEGIEEFKNRLGAFSGKQKPDRKLVSDLLPPRGHAVLVVPIDESAPKGRLILPQQQTIRELLDAGCSLSACRPQELASLLKSFRNPPDLVITDSQAFQTVAQTLPQQILLTSFSILFARYKGNLKSLVSGASRLSSIRNGEKILIAEGCTHHRQCGDIGTEKLPQWIRSYTGASPEFCFTSGGDFPTDLSDFSIILHCGGCMLNEAEMKSRLNRAYEAGIPMTNYGIAIAQMHGILYRALSPFPELQTILTDG